MEIKIEKDFCLAVKQEYNCQVIKFSDPAKDGAPDRLVLTPWGLPLFIEFKLPGENPRPNQMKYMYDLCKRGYLAFAANDATTPLNLVELLRASDDRTEFYRDLVTRQIKYLKRRVH